MKTATKTKKPDALTRTRTENDHRFYSRFYMEESNQTKHRAETTNPSGAFVAVQSAWDSQNSALYGTTGETAPLDVSLDDNTGSDPEMAAEQQLSFSKKVDRFFSRSMDFQIGNTWVRGKNGYQARGGSFDLGSGIAVDLSTAQLTGYRDQKRRFAVGSGAQLYFATLIGGSITRQPLNHIYVDSEQQVDGRATEPTNLRLASHQLELGPSRINSDGKTLPATIHFDYAQIPDSDPLGLSERSVGTVQLINGFLSIDQLTLHAYDHNTTLHELSLSDNNLWFERGEVACAEKTISFGGGMLDSDTIGKTIASAQLNAKKSGEPSVSTLLHSDQKLPTPEAKKDMSSVDSKVKPTLQAPATVADRLLALMDTTYDADHQIGKANFLLVSSLRTTGEYGLDLGRVVGATSEKNDFLLNDTGKITASLKNLTLKVTDPALKDYELHLIGAKLTDDVFSIDQLQVIKKTKGNLIESTHNADSGLEALLNFTIPKMPKRIAFTTLSANGAQLEASDSNVMDGLYSVQGLGGIFSASLDLAEKEFSISLEPNSNLTEEGFFSKDGIPLAIIPLFAGLSFKLSVTPTAKMGGEFGLSGKLPKGNEALSLSGKAGFNLDVGVELSGDLEMGLSQIAALYIGLFGKAGVNASTSLTTTILISHTDGKLQAKSLDFVGDVDAKLKGSIGAHGGAKLLLWKAELFSYTFKEWQLAALSLNATISKDMTQRFTKGWHLEQSSFTASAFGSLLTSESLNVEANQQMLLHAIQLEGDYAKLRKNVEKLVEDYTTLYQELGPAGGANEKQIMFDPETIKAQVSALLELKNQLSHQAALSLTEEQALRVQFGELEILANKKRAKEAAPRQKHQDRLTYLGVARELLQSQPDLPYDEVLRLAKNPTEEKLEKFELAKLNVYSTVLHHEETRLHYYQDKKKSKEVRKHQIRLQLLKETYDKNIPFDEKNRLLITLAEGDLATSLRQELHEKVQHRMAELDSEKAFLKSTNAATTDVDGERADVRIDARRLYEEKQYDKYNDQTINDQMEQLVARQAALTAIVKDSEGIQRTLQPLAVLGKGAMGTDTLQKIQNMLLEGTKLKQTADNFDYIKNAKNSRQTQQQYLKSALLGIDTPC